MLFTCPEDGLVLSQYPWTKTAVLKIDRLSSLSIDLWCNKISDYYQFTPVEVPVKRENVLLPDSEVVEQMDKIRPPSPVNENNYETDTDVDIDNLLHHAETLVHQVKVELNTGSDNPTKPQGTKQQSKKRKRSSHVEMTTSSTTPKKKQKSRSHVETANALDALHHEHWHNSNQLVKHLH